MSMVFVQDTFRYWKADAYHHLGQPKELRKELLKVGRFVSKNEAKYREDFLALNDTLSMLELLLERQSLLEIANQSISNQQKAIKQEYECWKSSEEQVDDVCLVGISRN